MLFINNFAIDCNCYQEYHFIYVPKEQLSKTIRSILSKVVANGGIKSAGLDAEPYQPHKMMNRCIRLIAARTPCCFITACYSISALYLRIMTTKKLLNG